MELSIIGNIFREKFLFFSFFKRGINKPWFLCVPLRYPSNLLPNYDEEPTYFLPLGICVNIYIPGIVFLLLGKPAISLIFCFVIILSKLSKSKPRVFTNEFNLSSVMDILEKAKISFIIFAVTGLLLLSCSIAKTWACLFLPALPKIYFH